MLRFHAENTVNVSRSSQRVTRSGDDDQTCAWAQPLGKSSSLAQWGYVTLVAMLLTSELATNAVEHSTRPTNTKPADTESPEPGDRPREFVVTVAFTPHGVIVTVQDPGSALFSGITRCGRGSGLRW
jgi:hypothetical protein